ncbi:M81 family metallopeptidase [Achromobacter xylosoxidans]
MREAVQAARQAEQGAVLGVSVLAGFALADIPAPCLSVVAVGVGEAGRAPPNAPWRCWPTRSGPTATVSTTAASRWPIRWRARPGWPKARTNRCCCWTMATTACRAAPATPWTC